MRFPLLAGLLASLPLPLLAAPAPRPTTLPQCKGVELTGAWLADATPRPGEPGSAPAGVKPASGPGYYVVLANHTDKPIAVAEPFPSSVDWYAQVGSKGPVGGVDVRLLWRASAGSGGALVDALRPAGPVFAAAAAPGAQRLTVPAHGQLSLSEPIATHPALDFRPGCQRCRNPGEHSYRAVLSYALLPAPGSPAGSLLGCGLRSQPFVMPPLP